MRPLGQFQTSLFFIFVIIIIFFLRKDFEQTSKQKANKRTKSKQANKTHTSEQKQQR